MSFEEPSDQMAVRFAAALVEATDAREPFATQASLAAKDLYRAVCAAQEMGTVDKHAVIAGALIRFAKTSIEFERREAKKERKMALNAAIGRIAKALEDAASIERGRE